VQDNNSIKVITGNSNLTKEAIEEHRKTRELGVWLLGLSTGAIGTTVGFLLGFYFGT
jgi:CO dehydrogenase/acetyl-CoA synthase gamma subunit (corrinoid Fe-S protein)